MSGRTILILAVLILGTLLVFGGSYTSAATRKKIVIEAATPNGPVSAASVIETRNSRAPWWYPTGTGNRSSVGARGEAPYLDFGNGRYLFVTLNNQLHEAPIALYLSARRLEADGSFKADQTPMLVTFSDITEPNSVRRVEPGKLEAAFGPGYRLLSLKAVDTNERATLGTLAKRFPDLHRELLRPAAQRVPGDFARTDLRKIGWDAFEVQDW